MKKGLLTIFVLTLGLFLTAGNAGAWYFSIDNPGEDTTFELYFTPDEGGTQLDNFQLDFCFDETELVWNGAYVNTPPSGLYPNFFGNLVDYDDNPVVPDGHFLWNFNASTFEDGPVVSETILLGSVTFELLDGALQDGEKDFWFDDEISPNILCTVDGTSVARHLINEFNDDGSPFVQYGEGLDVGAVPIPGAVWLLCSAFLGLIGIRRSSRV